MICASLGNFPHIQEFNQKVRKKFADFKICLIFAVPFHQMRDVALQAHLHIAEIAQLVEHDLAKVGVASSSLVFRSSKHQP